MKIHQLNQDDSNRNVMAGRFFWIRVARFALKQLNHLASKRPSSERGLYCNPRSYIGREIIFQGVYEARELDILGCVLKRLQKHFGRQLSIAVDIGANIGNHSVTLAPLFEKVIAVEAHPFTFKVLELNIEWSKALNIVPCCLGISSSNGIAQITDCDDLGGNHLIDSQEDTRDADIVSVELCRGDELFESVLGPDWTNTGQQIDFVKIDVESHEIEVLKGLQDTISTHQPILAIEFDLRNEKKGVPSELLPEYRFFEIQQLNTLWPGAPKVLDVILSLVQGRRNNYLVEILEFQDNFYPLVLCIPAGKVKAVL